MVGGSDGVVAATLCVSGMQPLHVSFNVSEYDGYSTASASECLLLTMCYTGINQSTHSTGHWQLSVFGIPSWYIVFVLHVCMCTCVYSAHCSVCSPVH